jgi:hypothetical protein
MNFYKIILVTISSNGCSLIESRGGNSMGYSYKQFFEDLQIGKEVQFVYNGQKYFIGWGEGEKRIFCKSQEAASSVISDSMEKLLKPLFLIYKNM